jgi:predicted tellurium resistance membrane protein TerC
MEMRIAFIIGIAVLLFTMYYLENEMEKKQIFWLFAGLAVVLGIISVGAVAQQAHNFDNTYLILTVLSVLIAILYFDEPEEEAPPQKNKKKKKKKKPKKKKSKGR